MLQESPAQVRPPPMRLHSLLCSWPRGGGGTACCPACIRVGLALFKQLGSSCKLPNTYFGRSAWPEARAFHYSGDISLNMLQFLHPQLRPQSQPQSRLDRRGALEECSALDYRQKQEVLTQGTVPGSHPALSFGQSTALCSSFQMQIPGASSI